MADRFELANADDRALLVRVLERYHERLLDAGVTVLLLHAFGPRHPETGELQAPALKVHGEPAMATVKATSLKHRVAGLPDVEITLDGDRWDELDEHEQEAVIDHELTHLVVVLEARGEAKRESDGHLSLVPSFRAVKDSAGRPKLRMRHHDHTFGWFDEVAARHGAASIEAKQARALAASQAGEAYFADRQPHETKTTKTTKARR